MYKVSYDATNAAHVCVKYQSRASFTVVKPNRMLAKSFEAMQECVAVKPHYKATLSYDICSDFADVEFLVKEMRPKREHALAFTEILREKSVCL